MDTIVSGMRPTGRLHLGHLHGALKNWLRLQENYRCYFFVADWHALTTDYASPQGIKPSTSEMVMDWLSVGLDPSSLDYFSAIARERACGAPLAFLNDNTGSMVGAQSHV